MTENYQKLAQKYYIDGDFKTAKELYSNLSMPLEVAYCELFLGHLYNAKKIIMNLKKESPAEEWIVSFVQMLEANLVNMPSFLQIRNFFEIDLNNLFLCGKKEWIENVINYVPILATVNAEIFKLAARVLKNNGQTDLAKKFLKKSLDIYFNDSETHFLLAEILIEENNNKDAKQHLVYACGNGGYAPAEKLLAKLFCN
ncbi:hypothetical protein IJS77_05445 [bacterium]|nr:hypothetical protein [bacterium]